MLVNTRAKVGVFSIALGAYLPQFPTLVPEFESQYENFKKIIPDTVEIIDGGIVTTKEASQKAGDLFRAADVDVVFLQLLTYATSYNMLPAIRDIDVPVVLVNIQKLEAPDYVNMDTPKWLGELYACGAVGEMVADLERAGKRHAVITGIANQDPIVQKEIEEWCKAAQVRRRFRNTNLAQIGRPYPGMMDLYIDETNLYHRMWVYTKQFDWEKMWAIADNVTDEGLIQKKAEEILDTFEIEGNATVETVWDMAKYVVAFEEWVKKEEIGLIASHYDGFAQGVAGKLDSMLIPAFSGLSAPYWNDDVRAMFYGMSRTTGRNEMVKAAVESIAYQITDILNGMASDSSLAIHQVKADGGPSKNTYLMQFLSDMARTTVSVSKQEELSAIGAAYLAGISVGLYNKEELFSSREYTDYNYQLPVSEWKQKMNRWYDAIRVLLKEY